MRDTAKLAIEGGPRAVAVPPPRRRRWGAAEMRRLSEMVEQESLFYWQAPQTTALIEGFRGIYPFKHVMPCSSGSASLHIAVAALRLPPGSEVVVPAITDMGSVIGVLYQQLVPVFADVNPESYNVTTETIAAVITPRTRAIMVVHLVGNPCDMTAIMALARARGLQVIEDCAQAWGARHQGRLLGAWGDFACYSFNDFKHLSCGEGGVTATNDDGLGEGLSKWGDKHYDRVVGGRDPTTLSPNYRISEPQAAVAAAQLERHDAIVARRIVLAERLGASLRGVPGLRLPKAAAGDTHSWWFYLLRLELARWRVTRDEVLAALQAEGVLVGGSYLPRPVPEYPIFRDANFFAGGWPLREAGLTAMDYRTVVMPGARAMLADCLVVGLNEEMSEAYLDGVAVAFAKVATTYGKPKV